MELCFWVLEIYLISYNPSYTQFRTLHEQALPDLYVFLQPLEHLNCPQPHQLIYLPDSVFFSELLATKLQFVIAPNFENSSAVRNEISMGCTHHASPNGGNEYCDVKAFFKNTSRFYPAIPEDSKDFIHKIIIQALTRLYHFFYIGGK